MRAKEYIKLHHDELIYPEILNRVIQDLMPLRMDKVATGKYMNNHLSSDIRYQHYMLKKELYERNNALQPQEPIFEHFENEINMDIAAAVRDELFHVIESDGSFGYLYYILGTEQNSLHNSEPIDCIPNEERIIQCIVKNRDDYPKTNLDDYINEKLNYQQYNTLIDGNYWDDNDDLYLRYFNRVYEMYDELRLRKQSVSKIKDYLKNQKYDSEAEKYWTLKYIISLINESEIPDDGLNRCKMELTRTVESIKEQFETNKISNSPVYLAQRKGLKIDIIRILNVLYELAVFTGENGKKISKKEFMITIGKAINIDLTNYDKDLSRALSDSTALDKHLRIFNDMRQKMTDIFNLH